MPLGIPDTRQFPWDQGLSYNLQQLTNKVTGGINTWTVRPTVGVDGATLGPNHVGYTGINTNTSAIERWDGTAWQVMLDGEKVVTTPQLEVYVNQTTGNDNNDGRTASTAWKTISKFYQEVFKYNLLGKQVNLYLGAGVYNIKFPPNVWGGRVRIYGASSSTVTIQNLTVEKATLVIVQDVTIGYPELLDSVLYYWAIQVTGNSNVQLGQNVVLGPIGTYNSSGNRTHILITDSIVHMFANCPITLSGSSNIVFHARGGSQLSVVTYYNPAAGTPYVNPAPAVNTGVVTPGVTALTASDTTAFINATGSISVSTFMRLESGSFVNGNPNWKLSITGSITGSAYTLLTGSYINGYVSRGSVPALGIGYPNSISSGTKDGDSIIHYGTAF